MKQQYNSIATSDSIKYYRITKTDLAALRKCDTIDIWAGCTPELTSPCTEVQCKKNVSLKDLEKDPFILEPSYRLWITSNIDMPYIRESCPNIKAHANFDNSYQDSEMHTITHHVLKVGDLIAFRWSANNNSDWMTKRGITFDSVHLVIKRKTKSKKRPWRKMHFMLKVNVCSSNSDFRRMVKGVPSGVTIF